MSEETYTLTIAEVESLMRLYTVVDCEKIPLFAAPDDPDYDSQLAEAGQIFRRMYHWNREHFNL